MIDYTLQSSIDLLLIAQKESIYGNTHINNIYVCNLEIVMAFLEFGADPNMNFPLNSAVMVQNLEMIKLLIDHGADPTFNGNKVLITAILSEDLEILNYLLSIMQIYEPDKMKLLYHAIISQNLPIIRRILQMGISPILFNKDSLIKSQIHQTLARDHPEIFNLIQHYLPENFLVSSKEGIIL